MQLYAHIYDYFNLIQFHWWQIEPNLIEIPHKYSVIHAQISGYISEKI